MSTSPILELLRETGALLEGHFLLSSGLHSERYFQCARLLQHPESASHVGEELARLCCHLNPEVVVAPALGGIIVAHEAARGLGTRALFAERVEGTLRFRRGFEIGPGERVLVVEDVVTTGKSTLETVAAVTEAGGEVIGLGALVDRSAGVDFPLPFYSLLKLHTPAYEKADCPLCRQGMALEKPGSRTIPLV